jgi:hypothetical protein
MTDTAVATRTATLKVTFGGTPYLGGERYGLDESIGLLMGLRSFLIVSAYIGMLEEPEMNPVNLKDPDVLWDKITFDEATNVIADLRVARLSYQSPFVAWLVGGGLTAAVGTVSTIALYGAQIWDRFCDVREKHHQTSQKVSVFRVDTERNKFLLDQVKAARKAQAKRFREMEKKDLAARLEIDPEPPLAEAIESGTYMLSAAEEIVVEKTSD